MKSVNDIESGLLHDDDNKTKPRPNPSTQAVQFLIFDISHFPKMSQFFILSSAVFVFYVVGIFFYLETSGKSLLELWGIYHFSSRLTAALNKSTSDLLQNHMSTSHTIRSHAKEV